MPGSRTPLPTPSPSPPRDSRPTPFEQCRQTYSHFSHVYGEKLPIGVRPNLSAKQFMQRYNVGWFDHLSNEDFDLHFQGEQTFLLLRNAQGQGRVHLGHGRHRREEVQGTRVAWSHWPHLPFLILVE